jgi:hypothetical protein
MTNRWKPFSNDELEAIQSGLRGERYTGTEWYEPNQQMLDEIEDELVERRMNEKPPAVQ